MIIDEEVYLEHFGVKGMHWGVRKDRTKSGSGYIKKKKDWGNEKRAAAILGSVAAAGAIAAGTIFANQHRSSTVGKAPEHAKKFAESQAREPVDIVHASRGRDLGYRFLRDGGLTDSLHEFETGFHSDTYSDAARPGYFHKYGEPGKEKVAATFADPLGRKDFAGRPISHQVIIPANMGAKHFYNSMQVEEEVWPNIKDLFGAYYEGRPHAYGPAY